MNTRDLRKSRQVEILAVTREEAAVMLGIGVDYFKALCGEWPEILGHSYRGYKGQAMWRTADIERASLKLAGYLVDTTSAFSTRIRSESGD